MDYQQASKQPIHQNFLSSSKTNFFSHSPLKIQKNKSMSLQQKQQRNNKTIENKKQSFETYSTENNSQQGEIQNSKEIYQLIPTKFDKINSEFRSKLIANIRKSSNPQILQNQVKLVEYQERHSKAKYSQKPSISFSIQQQQQQTPCLSKNQLFPPTPQQNYVRKSIFSPIFQTQQNYLRASSSQLSSPQLRKKTIIQIQKLLEKQQEEKKIDLADYLKYNFNNKISQKFQTLKLLSSQFSCNLQQFFKQCYSNAKLTAKKLQQIPGYQTQIETMILNDEKITMLSVLSDQKNLIFRGCNELNKHNILRSFFIDKNYEWMKKKEF